MKRSPINEGNVEMDRNTPVGVRITGVGAEVPPRVVTTAELEEQADIGRFGFEPGWLERVTAVTERRWAEYFMAVWSLRRMNFAVNDLYPSASMAEER